MTGENERDPIARLFDGLTPPGPPPELRDRVLAAIRSSPTAEPPADVWTRIWENRWLRIAWATCALALLAGHFVLVPPTTRSSEAVATVQVDEEIAELLRPVRIEASALPAVGRVSDDGHPPVLLDEGDNSL